MLFRTVLLRSLSVSLLMLAAAVVGLSLGQAALPHEDEERLPNYADVKMLQDVGVATDGPGLLEFFRKKTVSEEQRRRIVELIEQLGHSRFPVREKACQELIALGQAAVPALQQALQHADPEVVARARHCLKGRNATAPADVVAAAVRAVTARKPAGAAEVLLAFVPDANDPDVEDEIGRALTVLGVREGKADAALIQALGDKQPVRRAAAGAALGRAAIPAHREAVRKLLQDPHQIVRLRVALARVTAADREAVPVLIDLLPQLTPLQAWQVEDMLIRLAGAETRPAVALGSDEASRKKCRDAWTAWWTAHGANIDLTRLQETPRGWVSLFNGKDLAGWKTHPGSPGDWRVENGILVGRGPNASYLYTQRGNYEDFYFRVQARINTGGNSGQKFRKPFTAATTLDGYEAQIDSSSHPAKTGSLYVKDGTATVAIEQVLVPVDTWFTQEVIAHGNHIVILVNGRKTVDYIDTNHTWRRGHLALQVYEPNTVVQFRSIEVKELGWVPLFRGRDLSAFHAMPGAWRLERSVLQGTPPAARSAHATFLSSPQIVRDFELKFRVKLEDGLGGSGVIIRGTAGADLLLPNGPLIKVGDGWGGWGHLTSEPFGKPLIPMPQEKQNTVDQLVNKNDFNHYYIRCVGKHVTIQVNGFTTVDQVWEALPHEGILAFQIHYARGTRSVQFHNVEIKEL